MSRFRTLATGERLFVGWLMLSLSLGVSMMVLGSGGARNSTLAHLSLPVFCTLGLWTFGELATLHRYRVVVRTAAVCYLFVWAVLSSTNGVQAEYSFYAHPLMNLTLTFAAAGLIVIRLKQVRSRPLHDAVVLFGLGALITYAPAAAIDPVASIMTQSDPQLAIELYLSRAGFLLIGAIPYTLGFLWAPPRPLSSGS